MPYTPPTTSPSSSAGFEVDADGYIKIGDGVPFKAVIEQGPNGPIYSIKVKDIELNKEVTVGSTDPAQTQ